MCLCNKGWYIYLFSPKSELKWMKWCFTINVWPQTTLSNKSKAKSGTEVILLQAGPLSPNPPPLGLEKNRENRGCCPLVLCPGWYQICQALLSTLFTCPGGAKVPGARLEFRTHHAGWCVMFWTCLLSVKQTGLASKNKSRLIDNQKCHNSPQENLHVHFIWMCSMALILTTHHSSKRNIPPWIVPDH